MNQTILDDNVMNMSLIITEGKYGAIDAYDSSCNGYYIIKNISSPYTLQEDLSIDGQVIYFGEMVFEVTYLFQININSHFMFNKKLNHNSVLILSTTDFLNLSKRSK